MKARMGIHGYSAIVRQSALYMLFNIFANYNYHYEPCRQVRLNHNAYKTLFKKALK